MVRDYEKRARELFAECDERLDDEVRQMMADHPMRKVLQSGAAAKKAIAIYEEHSRAALDHALGEVAKLIDHHGGEWDRAMIGIDEDITSHVDNARFVLAAPLRTAGAEGESAAARAVDSKLEDLSLKLHPQLENFRKGRTAPLPKTWKERHPNLDRALFSLFGVLVSADQTYSSDRLNPGPTRHGFRPHRAHFNRADTASRLWLTWRR